MRRINLVSKESIKANAYVDSNITDDTLDTAIQLAQEVKLKPVLGTALYEKITSDALAGTLAGDYKDLVDNRLQQVLTYYTVKYIVDNKFQRISESGINKDENSLSVEELRVIQGNIKSLYMSYESDLIEYLKASVDKFPEYDDVIQGEVTAEQRVSSDALFDVSTILEPEAFASSALGESSASDTYNKNEIDSLLDKKLNKDLGELTPAEITTFKNTLQIDNVENTADADKPLSTAAINALNVKEPSFVKNTAFNKDFGVTAGTVAEGYHTHGQYEPKNPNIQAHIADRSNPHLITATTIGLSRVDNTYDREKPISETQAAEFETKADKDTIPVTYLNKIEESKGEAIEDARAASEAYTDTKTGELNTALVGEINTAKNEAITYTDDSINNLLIESPHPYPIANPASKIQRCLDSKKRFYDAVGTSSLLDWEVTKSIGARGVKYNSTQNVLPSLSGDFTLSIWASNLYDFASYWYVRMNSLTRGFSRELNGNFYLRYINENSDILGVGILHKQLLLLTYVREGSTLKIYVNDVEILNTQTTTDNWEFGVYDSEIHHNLYRQFNFAANPEQIREWYNTGRVDRYELPFVFKEKTTFNSIIPSFSELEAKGTATLTDLGGGEVQISKSSAGSGASILTSMLPNWRKLLLIEFDAKADVVTGNFGIAYFTNTVGAEEYNIISNPIISNDYQHYAAFIYIETKYPYFGYFPSIVSGDVFIKNLKLSDVGCLHEYKGSNIQPHKLVDTGATPEDKLLNGATPTFEPEYQEFISAEGAPTVIPQIEQQSYLDTTNDKLYKSTDTTSATDWELLN